MSYSFSSRASSFSSSPKPGGMEFSPLSVGQGWTHDVICAYPLRTRPSCAGPHRWELLCTEYCFSCTNEHIRCVPSLRRYVGWRRVRIIVRRSVSLPTFIRSQLIHLATRHCPIGLRIESKRARQFHRRSRED